MMRETHPLADWHRLEDDPPPERVMDAAACVHEALEHAAVAISEHEAALGFEMAKATGRHTDMVLISLAEILEEYPRAAAELPTDFLAEILRGLAGYDARSDIRGDTRIALSAATTLMEEWAPDGPDSGGQGLATATAARLAILARALRAVMPPEMAALDAQVRSPQHAAWLVACGVSDRLNERQVPVSEGAFRRIRRQLDAAVIAASAIDEPDVALWTSQLLRCITGDPDAKHDPVAPAVADAGLRFLEGQLAAASAGERLRSGELARISAEYLGAIAYGAGSLLPPEARFSRDPTTQNTHHRHHRACRRGDDGPDGNAAALRGKADAEPFAGCQPEHGTATRPTGGTSSARLQLLVRYNGTHERRMGGRRVGGHPERRLMAYVSAAGDLRCRLCDSLLERRHDRSWACASEDCPHGALNQALMSGTRRDDAIRQFRLQRRRQRGTDRERFDDEAARDLCGAAARAWPPPEHKPCPDPVDEIETALRSAGATDAALMNARNWLELVMVGEPLLPITRTLWRGYHFGEELPCPLGPEFGSCTNECEACEGMGLLLQDCDHCAPYVQIIPAALVDSM